MLEKIGFALGYWSVRIYSYHRGILLFVALVIAGVIYLPRGWSGLGAMVATVLGGLLISVVVVNPSLFTGRFSQVLLPLGMSAVVYFYSPETVPSTEFYKAAAQVLPVLLLVFIVEKRREFHRPEFVEQPLANLMVIIFVVVAGHETLQVLAFDDASRGDARYVYAALVTTLTVLFVSLLTPPVREVPADPEGGSQTSEDPEPDPDTTA